MERENIKRWGKIQGLHCGFFKSLDELPAKNQEEKDKNIKTGFTDLIFLGFERWGNMGKILNDFLGIFCFSCSGFPTAEKDTVNEALDT